MQNQPAGSVAIINMFTVQPDDQEKLLDIVTTYSREVACKWPGFISARFHASLDKTRVTSVVYWESQEACRAFIQSPSSQPFLARCEPLIQQTASHFYTVVESVLVSSEA